MRQLFNPQTALQEPVPAHTCSRTHHLLPSVWHVHHTMSQLKRQQTIHYWHNMPALTCSAAGAKERRETEQTQHTHEKGGNPATPALTDSLFSLHTVSTNLQVRAQQQTLLHYALHKLYGQSAPHVHSTARVEASLQHSKRCCCCMDRAQALGAFGHTTLTLTITLYCTETDSLPTSCRLQFAAPTRCGLLHRQGATCCTDKVVAMRL
jgi:hypothetical protein